MEDDLILQRIKELYQQKILTKQVLTEEELMFFGREVIRLKDNGMIEDEQYSNYMLGTILNPTAAQFLSSEDFAEVIGSLRELRGNSEVRYTGDGHNFTDYERTLYHLLNRPEILLNDQDRARLISEVADSSYTFYYLSNPEMSRELKEQLLYAMQEQKYATREDYFAILHKMCRDENSPIPPGVFFEIIKHAKEYRLEEVTEEQDFEYNKFLCICARDMQNVGIHNKIEILMDSQDPTFIRELIEGKNTQIMLSNKEKEFLIIALNDEKYIESILRGEIEVSLGQKDFIELINKNFMEPRMDRALAGEDLSEERKAYYSKYLYGEGYKFSLEDKLGFAKKIGDADAYKFVLENNSLTPIEQLQCLELIGSPEYAREFIARQDDVWRVRLNFVYVMAHRNGRRKR